MRAAYRGGVAVVVAVVVLASITPFVVGTAAAATHTVDDDPGADYSTIQAAIDDASAGDTIEVAPGTYAGAIVVDKPLTLVGASGAVITGGTVGITVEASADDTTITGFEFRDFSDAAVSPDLDATETLSNFELRQNTFSNADVEVEFRPPGSVTLDGTTISENQFVDGSGFDVDGSGLDGVTITEFRFEDNVMDGSSGDAIDVDLDSANTVATMVFRGNTIRDAEFDAIEFELAADGVYDFTIEDNTIDGSGSDAIEVQTTGGDDLTASIVNNELLNSGGSVLHVQGGDVSAISVTGNDILGNANGIRNDGSGDLNAENNYWGSNDGPTGDQRSDPTVDTEPFATEPVVGDGDSSASSGTGSGGANIEIHDATFSPADPVVGEEVTISVEVANDGTRTGYLTGMFRSDFTPHDTFDVTVGPGETRTLSTTVVYEKAGQYNVYVADEYVGSLTVEARDPMRVTVTADPANDTVDATVENPRRTAIDIPIPPVNAPADSGVVLTNVAVTPVGVDDFQLGITQTAYTGDTVATNASNGTTTLPDGTAPVSAITFDSSLANDRIASVQLTFTVDTTRYPSLADVAVGDTVAMYRYDAATDTYTERPGTVVETADGSFTATVELDGFSTYLLGVDRSAFDVDTSVSGNPVAAGDSLRVALDVTNTGDGAGVYTPTVAIAGTPVEAGSLTLVAGETDTLVVRVPTSRPGYWPVTVDGRFVGLAVVEASDER